MSYPRHTLIRLKSTAEPLIPPASNKSLFYDWVQSGYPLIYPRQSQAEHIPSMQVAIPAYISETHQKVRCSYLIHLTDVVQTSALPTLAQIFSVTSPHLSHIQVYGSFCWEYLTQRPYVHAESDLDILIPYSDQSIADIQCIIHDIKQQVAIDTIDGEMRFEGIGDCAIAELTTLRNRKILFKNNKDVFFVHRSWLQEKYPFLALLHC